MSRFPQHHAERNITAFNLDGTIRENTPVPLPDPTDHTMPKLIEALGGAESFEALPVLSLDTCAAWGGITGYIDFVKPADMTCSIMRGEDSLGRPFVAFRLLKRVLDYESPNYPNDLVDEEFVETLFRRYPKGGVWVSGGEFDLVSSVVDDEVLASIKSLVSEGQANGVALAP